MEAEEVVDLDGSLSTSLVGRVVGSEEEAFELYNNYAKEVGFSVRKGNQRYILKTNVLREKDYVCACEGLKVIGDLSNYVKYKRKVFRTGCLAMIRFAIVNDQWKVTTHRRKHNHYLADDFEVQYLRSHRKITTEKASLIDTFKEAGFQTSQLYNFVCEEAYGADKVGYTRRDCYNYVNQKRITLIDAGDAQSLINAFQKKKKADPSFFFTEQLDQQGRLTNFFWTDGISRADYESFGDVVVFDTTYRTNRYNLICAPFVGVNHHWKNVMFGCAFLLDEKTESFVWLFKAFLDAMGDRHPKTIITDQDQAMAKAIETVLPETVHRLCLWHISKNYTDHLGRLNSEPDFMRLFKKCLYRTKSEDEFESTWKEMIEKFQCEEHVWLRSFYKVRHKWCRGINKAVFSGDIKSSQRSESTNNVLNGIACQTTGLLEFLNGYSKLVERWRESEKHDQFQTKRCSPPLAVKNSGILEHAAKCYTISLYKIFEQEYLRHLGTSWREASISGRVKTYEVTVHKSREQEGDDCVYENEDDVSELPESKVQTVIFNGEDDSVTCSCKKYESFGMLCCHALKVLTVNNYRTIPEKYILRRWTKEAKSNGNTMTSGIRNNVESGESDLIFRNRQLRRCYNVVVKCDGKVDLRSVLDNGITRLEDDVDEKITDPGTAGGGDTDAQQVVHGRSDECRRNDPEVRKRKGHHNGRIEAHFEKRKGKVTKKTFNKGNALKKAAGRSKHKDAQEVGEKSGTSDRDFLHNMHVPGVGNLFPAMMPYHIPCPSYFSAAIGKPSFVSMLEGMHHPAYYPNQSTQ